MNFLIFCFFAVFMAIVMAEDDIQCSAITDCATCQAETGCTYCKDTGCSKFGTFCDLDVFCCAEKKTEPACDAQFGCDFCDHNQKCQSDVCFDGALSYSGIGFFVLCAFGICMCYFCQKSRNRHAWRSRRAVIVTSAQPRQSQTVYQPQGPYVQQGMPPQRQGPMVAQAQTGYPGAATPVYQQQPVAQAPMMSVAPGMAPAVYQQQPVAQAPMMSVAPGMPPAVYQQPQYAPVAVPPPTNPELGEKSSLLNNQHH